MPSILFKLTFYDNKTKSLEEIIVVVETTKFLIFEKEYELIETDGYRAACSVLKDKWEYYTYYFNMDWEYVEAGDGSEYVDEKVIGKAVLEIRNQLKIRFGTDKVDRVLKNIFESRKGNDYNDPDRQFWYTKIYVSPIMYFELCCPMHNKPEFVDTNTGDSCRLIQKG